MRLPLCRISATHLFTQASGCRQKAHAEDDIQVTGDVHAYDLDSHPTSLIRTLRHVRKAPAFDFYGAFRTIRDVHGLWDCTVSAARFAKLIEQL